ncbi:MAG: hypothetical protein BRC30_00265 [Nanohaloarchaea archaeon SW_7_46_7]|nr:MAG: hypothetical protein BRC30_00265 [Nanohaloarchaea archaeon SW_7_46_7]
MIELQVLIELSTALIAALISMAAGKLYWNIKEDSETVLTSFKLRADLTRYDFLAYLVGELFLVITFLIYVAGGIMENKALVLFSRVQIVGFLGVITYGVLRMWWRSR